MNREILRIALPAIVANITVPLLGLVDTAIAGHLGDKVFIGAVAVTGGRDDVQPGVFETSGSCA